MPYLTIKIANAGTPYINQDGTIGISKRIKSRFERLIIKLVIPPTKGLVPNEKYKCVSANCYEYFTYYNKFKCHAKKFI